MAAARRRMSPEQREQEALINALMEVPEKELLCRDPGIAHSWNRTQDFHVIRARFRKMMMQMIARDSQCSRCGKIKQERFVVTAGDLLQKVGNYYSKYEVVLTGFPRGRNKAQSVWTAGYRKAMKDAAGRAQNGSLRAVK